MKITKLKLATLIGLLVCSLSANATIIDNGSYTTDTITGLDWLDVTETLGLSVDQVLASPLYNDWHYATADQFSTLIYNIIGINITDYYEDTRSYTTFYRIKLTREQSDNIIQLLGSTLDKYIFMLNGFPTDDEYLRSIGNTDILHFTYTNGLLSVDTNNHLVQTALVNSFININYTDNFLYLVCGTK